MSMAKCAFAAAGGAVDSPWAMVLFADLFMSFLQERFLSASMCLSVTRQESKLEAHTDPFSLCAEGCGPTAQIHKVSARTTSSTSLGGVAQGSAGRH